MGESNANEGAQSDADVIGQLTWADVMALRSLFPQIGARMAYLPTQMGFWEEKFGTPPEQWDEKTIQKISEHPGTSEITRRSMLFNALCVMAGISLYNGIKPGLDDRIKNASLKDASIEALSWLKQDLTDHPIPGDRTLEHLLQKLDTEIENLQNDTEPDWLPRILAVTRVFIYWGIINAMGKTLAEVYCGPDAPPPPAHLRESLIAQLLPVEMAMQQKLDISTDDASSPTIAGKGPPYDDATADSLRPIFKKMAGWSAQAMPLTAGTIEGMLRIEDGATFVQCAVDLLSSPPGAWNTTLQDIAQEVKYKHGSPAKKAAFSPKVAGIPLLLAFEFLGMHIAHKEHWLKQYSDEIERHRIMLGRNHPEIDARWQQHLEKVHLEHANRVPLSADTLTDIAALPTVSYLAWIESQRINGSRTAQLSHPEAIPPIHAAETRLEPPSHRREVLLKELHRKAGADKADQARG